METPAKPRSAKQRSAASRIASRVDGGSGAGTAAARELMGAGLSEQTFVCQRPSPYGFLLAELLFLCDGREVGAEATSAPGADMTARRLFPLSLVIAVASGFALIGYPAAVTNAAPLQMCTAQTLQGFPISGNVCGGTTYGFQCSAGVIYRCQSGSRFQQNNCTLSQVCSVGCLTRPPSATSTS